MLKICTKCNKSKDLDNFDKHIKVKSGYRSICKLCTTEYYKQYYTTNKSNVLLNQKIYKDKTKGLTNNNTATRRARKLQATLKCLTPEDLEAIKEFYIVARWLTEAFEEDFHVDHIIPLNGKTVCGLHVPWNLQILTAKENLEKGISY